MPRLGDYEFPDSALDETLAAARTLAKELGRQDGDKEELARVLGRGDIRIAVSQLKKLGLLDEKEKRFQASTLARRLARRRASATYINALLELSRTIPLFRVFLENALQYGVATNKDDLSRLVAIVTSAKREDIDARIDGLWDQYQSFLTEVLSVLATPGRSVAADAFVDPTSGFGPAAQRPVERP
jgi:hypothetical protein